MKHESHDPQTEFRTAAFGRTKFIRLALLLTAGFLALNATARVQVVGLDPPLSLNAFAEVPTGASEDLLLNVLPFDLNLDGEVDYRLAYGYGGIGAYFNGPTRFARRETRPGVAPVGGPVAALPLGSTIGASISSSITTNHYVWSEGYTNRYDLTQPLGDHEATVIIANLTTGQVLGPVISVSTDGTLVTNFYYGGPVVSGDVAGKEGVMALEFYVNGQPHYGYIHFDFRSPTATPLGGSGGVIYGWAYETEPALPIKALSLLPDTNCSDQKQLSPRTAQSGRAYPSRPMRK